MASMFSAFNAMAAEKADLEAIYTCQAPQIGDSTKLQSRNMTLVCNSLKSKWFNEMSEYCDSLTSTPDGKNQLRKIQAAAWMTQGPDGSITVDMTKGNAPRKTVYTYVLTDVRDARQDVYDKLGDELVTYSEPLDGQKWEIVDDSLATIKGHECVMAVTDYHGRRWKAWFAPELPVQFGPWKLRGLPGLILKAETPGGFSFEVTDLGASSREIKPVYSQNDYQRTDRKKALSDEEYYHNNALKLLQAKHGVTVNVSGVENPKASPKDYIECDY